MVKRNTQEQVPKTACIDGERNLLPEIKILI
jgi:hypothetical protein